MILISTVHICLSSPSLYCHWKNSPTFNHWASMRPKCLLPSPICLKSSRHVPADLHHSQPNSSGFGITNSEINTSIFSIYIVYIMYIYIYIVYVYTNASPQPEMTQIESFEDSLNPKVGSFQWHRDVLAMSEPSLPKLARLSTWNHSESPIIHQETREPILTSCNIWRKFADRGFLGVCVSTTLVGTFFFCKLLSLYNVPFFTSHWILSFGWSSFHSWNLSLVCTSSDSHPTSSEPTLAQKPSRSTLAGWLVPHTLLYFYRDDFPGKCM